jgi:hypothetical protein
MKGRLHHGAGACTVRTYDMVDALIRRRFWMYNCRSRYAVKTNFAGRGQVINIEIALHWHTCLNILNAS